MKVNETITIEYNVIYIYEIIMYFIYSVSPITNVTDRPSSNAMYDSPDQPDASRRVALSSCKAFLFGRDIFVPSGVSRVVKAFSRQPPYDPAALRTIFLALYLIDRPMSVRPVSFRRVSISEL